MIPKKTEYSLSPKVSLLLEEYKVFTTLATKMT